jgi:hypothetical protein
LVAKGLDAFREIIELSVHSVILGLMSAQ